MSNPARLDAETVAEAVPRLREDVTVSQAPDGAIRLRSAELRRTRLGSVLAWLFRLPLRIEVELDEIGSWVVARMDGRSMQDIATDLAADRKLTLREAEAALTVFVQSLLARRLLTLEGLIRSCA